MTDTLKWGIHEFKTGERLIALADPRVLIIEDIYVSEHLENGIYVVLGVGEDTERLLIAGDEFAYRVDRGELKRVTAPLFTVGQKFTHHATNDTIEIRFVPDREDWKGSYQYFVMMVNERGEVTFTTVSEKYLSGCIGYHDTVKMPLVLPEITTEAVFPGVVLV